MKIRNAILLGVAVLLAVPSATHAMDNFAKAHVQFCWVTGKFDHTVYYAEVEDREDRQASFSALIGIFGIDHHPVECRISDPGAHRLLRTESMKRWSDSEFEIVNTTFLSDLDY